MRNYTKLQEKALISTLHTGFSTELIAHGRTIDSLVKLGLMTVNSCENVYLTPKGKEVAHSIIYLNRWA